MNKYVVKRDHSRIAIDWYIMLLAYTILNCCYQREGDTYEVIPVKEKKYPRHTGLCDINSDDKLLIFYDHHFIPLNTISFATKYYIIQYARHSIVIP